MPKHTPGPWSYDREGWCVEADQWENQRLCLAAPDLLEACKIVLDGYDNPDSDGYFDWPEAAEKIRAAIAKAEGNRVLGKG